MTSEAQRQARRARLSSAKQALLAQRLTASADDAGNRIRQRADQQMYPLSFAQERLWFLAQLEPDSPAYNRPLTLRLNGPLDLSALEIALSDIVQRHQVLQATFTTVDGQPVQRIRTTQVLRLPLVDLSNLSASERAQQTDNLLAHTIRQPFDLSKNLFRTTLLRLSHQEHILLIVIHHIAFDAWSAQLFVQDLTTAYQADEPLPEPPLQYADFADWQRTQYISGAYDSQLDYWRQQLGGECSVLSLPTDRPHPAVQTYQGASEPLRLEKRLTRALRIQSQQAGVTLFMTLVAAFKVLLYRYTAQEDIIVGSPINNRNQVELEGLIGFVVNTLVLRTDLSGNPTWSALLQRVREVTLGAYANQNIPFEKLVAELENERDMSRHPLFQVMVTMHNRQPAGQSTFYGDLTVSQFPFNQETAEFDLHLLIVEIDGELSGTLHYNTNLFDTTTIRRMSKHLKILLEGVVAKPETPISNLPLLTADERHQLLYEWNNTDVDYPQDQCIHQLFEQQVKRTPDKIAVSFTGQTLSYQQLNTRANQLAHYLRSLTDSAEQLLIQPDTLISICVERSLEMIIGLLGILKAGAAYVPLDPDYPAPRLQFMLTDSQAPVLLTQQSLQDRFADYSGTLVCLDTSNTVSTQPEHNPVSHIRPDHLAYVIYTSGSTGQPKGVMIEHRNTTSLIQWALTNTNPACLQGVLAATSITFDLSVYELFVTLCAGGCILLAQDALQLASLPEKQAVTLINTVPSVITELFRSRAIPASVRQINLAGEPLTQALAQDLHTLPHLKTLYNLYGPSEDTTYSTWCRVSQEQRPTIGQPIANTRMYILDTRYQPAPVGVPGELCIAGDGLARGYLHQPDLTAERFIELKLFGSTERVYKAGDRARWLPDGHLEYLGRLDHQIKLRGFRIEPGEIEAVLCEHEAVREAVVVLRGTADNPTLAAYVTSATDEDVALTPHLRDWLTTRLPAYMMPGFFTQLDKLPLTPNGKIDRQALPAPDTVQHSTQLIAPQNDLERTLAQDWQHLLSLDTVGRNTNFFECGGNSLIAVRLHQQLQRQGHELKLTDLFHYPTIALLARHLRSTQHPSFKRTLPHKQTRASSQHRQRRRRARHHHDSQR